MVAKKILRSSEPKPQRDESRSSGDAAQRELQQRQAAQREQQQPKAAARREPSKQMQRGESRSSTSVESQPAQQEQQQQGTRAKRGCRGKGPRYEAKRAERRE